MFTTITYRNLGPSVARINRTTGDLYINPDIWHKLNPDQKTVILLHERGHFKLQTPSELKANQYAIEHYLNCGSLNDKEFGRRVIVLSDMLNKNIKIDQMQTHYSNFSPEAVGGVGSFLAAIPGLAALGVGSKARAREIDSATRLEAARTARITTTLVIAAVVIILLAVLYFVIKRKK